MDDKRRSVISLIVAVALPLIVGGVGGIATSSSVTTWYPSLNKPSFNPPGWIFGPVWTTLYVMMGVASWRVWRKGERQALSWYGIQLALNLLWSVLFFGLRQPGAALVEIVVLWAAILVTAVKFARVDTLAGVLMVPYQLWVSFAAILNGAIWWLNWE